MGADTRPDSSARSTDILDDQILKLVPKCPLLSALVFMGAISSADTGLTKATTKINRANLLGCLLHQRPAERRWFYRKLLTGTILRRQVSILMTFSTRCTCTSAMSMVKITCPIVFVRRKARTLTSTSGPPHIIQTYSLH